MRSEEEIKARLLELFLAREKFERLTTEADNGCPNKKMLWLAKQTGVGVYSGQIDLLKWVLNDSAPEGN
jgi:hypothetical protein